MPGRARSAAVTQAGGQAVDGLVDGVQQLRIVRVLAQAGQSVDLQQVERGEVRHAGGQAARQCRVARQQPGLAGDGAEGRIDPHDALVCIDHHDAIGHVLDDVAGVRLLLGEPAPGALVADEGQQQPADVVVLAPMGARHQARHHEQQAQAPDHHTLEERTAEYRHEKGPDQQHRSMIPRETLARTVFQLPGFLQPREIVAHPNRAAEHYRRAAVLPTHLRREFGKQHADKQQQQQNAEEAKKRLAHLHGLEHPVAADQQRQVRTDEGHGGEQVDDHLGAPERHLAPGQQVAHEGLGHQRQEDQRAEDPDELAGLAVGTVEQAAEHVQIHHDEERRGAGGVHVADQPAARHVTHDVFDRSEGHRDAGGVQGGIRLVVHHQEDAGDDLDHQHQQGQRAEEIPEVEVLRCVVLGNLFLHHFSQREPSVHPA